MHAEQGKWTWEIWTVVFPCRLPLLVSAADVGALVLSTPQQFHLQPMHLASRSSVIALCHQQICLLLLCVITLASIMLVKVPMHAYTFQMSLPALSKSPNGQATPLFGAPVRNVKKDSVCTLLRAATTK